MTYNTYWPLLAVVAIAMVIAAVVSFRSRHRPGGKR
jgi:hypothetical protein